MRHGFLTLLAVTLLACSRTASAADDADDLRAADEALLKSGGVKSDAAGLLEFFRKRTPSAKDFQRMETLIKQLASEQFDEREQASNALKEIGEPALPLLRKAVVNPDIEVSLRARNCVSAIESLPGPELAMTASRALARLAPADAAATLLAYLPHAYDGTAEDEVCEALALLSIRARGVDPALTAALADPSALRRGGAAFALGRRSEEATRAGVRRLLGDKDRQVRLRATEGLLAGRDRTAIPTLIELATGPPDELTWRAESLLFLVAGESAPARLPDAEDQLGRARRAAWMEWWQASGDKVDLAGIEEGPRPRNVTLIPEMHANKVWECGPDGKARWEVAVPGCPINAQVLPGGRILVAELSANRVTERDYKGTVEWKFDIHEPIACQRLSNGHIWMATNHKWLVVDSEGKEIISYAAEDKFYIHSIQRQPNGHVVMISMDGKEDKKATIREVTAKGALVRDVELPIHSGWSGVESVPSGRYLATNHGQGKVVEVDAKGKVVWEYKTEGACYAQRLPNGHTLVVSNTIGLIEVDKDKNIVWKQEVSSALWRAHRR